MAIESFARAIGVVEQDRACPRPFALISVHPDEKQRAIATLRAWATRNGSDLSLRIEARSKIARDRMISWCPPFGPSDRANSPAPCGAAC